MLRLPRDCLHILNKQTVFLLYQHKVNFCLISTNSQYHLPIFLSLIPYIYIYIYLTHNSFSRHNSNNILPSKLLWPTPYPPLYPSICLPPCPLRSPRHITKSPALLYLTHLSAHHKKTVFSWKHLPLCAAYPQINLSLFKNNNSHHYHLPFLHLPPFHTAPPSP